MTGPESTPTPAQDLLSQKCEMQVPADSRLGGIWFCLAGECRGHAAHRPHHADAAPLQPRRQGHVCRTDRLHQRLCLFRGQLPFQGGTDTPPPNGVTTNNTTTNLAGILPFGEVFFRSAVFDPVRGYAYLGQDSRPNQIVKVKLAKDTPVITSAAKLPGGAFQFGFTFTPGVACIALGATNAALPLTDWSLLGGLTEISAGQFQFTDSQATNSPQRFYRFRSP